MPAQPLDARAGAARRIPGGPGSGRRPRAQHGAARDARLAGGPIRGGEGGVDDIQLVVNELLAANVLMRLGDCQER